MTWFIHDGETDEVVTCRGHAVSVGFVDLLVFLFAGPPSLYVMPFQWYDLDDD